MPPRLCRKAGRWPMSKMLAARSRPIPRIRGGQARPAIRSQPQTQIRVATGMNHSRTTSSPPSVSRRNHLPTPSHGPAPRCPMSGKAMCSPMASTPIRPAALPTSQTDRCCPSRRCRIANRGLPMRLPPTPIKPKSKTANSLAGRAPTGHRISIAAPMVDK